MHLAKSCSETMPVQADVPEAFTNKRKPGGPKRVDKNAVKLEAERRAAFVRGVGHAECGYCDGYADGFEQAIQWLAGELFDPFAPSYRRAAGMTYVQNYYAIRPKERKRILEWFKNIKPQPLNDKR